MRVSRRTFLALGAAVVVGACSDDAGTEATTTPTAPAPTTSAAPTTTAAPATTATTTTTTTTTTAPPTTQPGPAEYTGADDPFTLGVASGDPDSGSVVLWTRLAPDPLAGGLASPDEFAVRWQVATDEGFDDVVAEGSAGAIADHGHSVHVEVGGLEPDTWYWYRFLTGPHTSPVGRTRTMPADDAVADRYVLAVANCQHYESGFYAAHRDIAASEVDAVAFLGDYIYEGAAGTGGVRSHGTPEPTDLAGYRNRYALYKLDADLQAAHAACPWFVIWDDHEVENNYAGLQSEDATVAPATFSQRRRQAYQVWWEHMPVRLPAPTGDDYPIYRQARVGALAELTMIDSRQYRSDQACGDVALSLDPACPETFDETRTMLGEEQERWFGEAVGATGAVWTVLANQVILSNLIVGGAVLNYDMWDGYPAARDRLLQAVVDADPANFVVITGDIHFSGVANLRGPGSDPARPLIGTEFVTTSISSEGNVDPSIQSMKSFFPDIVDLELVHRGWTKHTITPERWSAEYRNVDDVTDPGSAITSYATFTVQAGTPGAA